MKRNLRNVRRLDPQLKNLANEISAVTDYEDLRAAKEAGNNLRRKLDTLEDFSNYKVMDTSLDKAVKSYKDTNWDHYTIPSWDNYSNKIWEGDNSVYWEKYAKILLAV